MTRGTDLDYSYQPRAGRPSPAGPSFDRIDTTKGYVKDNIDIICWRCNAIKRDATLEELEAIVEYMRKNLCP